MTKSLLVFDIESYAKPAAQQDEKILAGLTRYAKDEAEKKDILDKLGLNPITGEVACIGLFDWTRQRPAIFYRSDLGKIDNLTPFAWDEQNLDVQIQARANEKELLEAVWEILPRFDCLLTFNGRTFDYPFLMQRSFLLGVTTKRHLFANRYHINKHLDLCDYLTGFGASRRYSLDLLSRGMGLTSPKDDGMDGAQVSPAIDAGRLTEVADYCLRDVRATALLARQAFHCFPDDLSEFSSLR